jgi:hypothetical protein
VILLFQEIYTVVVPLDLRGIGLSGYHYQGHMQQDDHFSINYSRSGFQKEYRYFGSVGY